MPTTKDLLNFVVKKMTYEQAYQELLSEMKRLEQEQMTIDEMLALHRRCDELVQFCRVALRNAKEQIDDVSDTKTPD